MELLVGLLVFTVLVMAAPRLVAVVAVMTGAAVLFVLGNALLFVLTNGGR